MKLAQDYLKETASGETRGGFNSRLLGDSLSACMENMPSGNRWGERNNGWTIADEMIRAGKIYSQYETKGGKKIELKCYIDGNKWCCVGSDFTNLQECAATFGDTQNDAIDKYLMKRNVELTKMVQNER